MSLTADDVRHVAALAKLELADDDLPALTADLGAILGYIDRIADARLDADALEPAPAPLRADAVQPSEPGPLLDAAPALHEGLFSLPNVVP